MKKCIVMNIADNVATTLQGAERGDTFSVLDYSMHEIGRIESNEVIPFAHKIALKNITKGDYVIKYGEIIGIATETIEVGSYVHIHNLASLRGKIKAHINPGKDDT